MGLAVGTVALTAIALIAPFLELYSGFGGILNLVIIGIGLPILMHPQEAVAALVWFSAVTWLMTRTCSIWDCILAHAVTNLLGFHAFHDIKIEALVFIAITVLIIAGFGPSLKGWRLGRARHAAA